jgi:glutamate carboxypeptidase
MGIPTLDGLGALGDGAHSVDEYIFIPSLTERAALLAALLVEW